VDAVALYGFQLVPDVRVVTRDRGWPGWFEEKARPLIDQGIRDHHLHNPFGLHEVPGRDRVMHIDQFELSFCHRLTWLADLPGFVQAVEGVHERGGTVRAYVGSPLVVRQPPQEEYLPQCLPGSDALSSRLRLLGPLGLCGPWLMRGCLCWARLIRFHITPLIDARVDAIGFDNSFDFHPGDCMDRLVRSILATGTEVMIEPWPRKDRGYPRVSWIIRELLYERITLAPREDEAPLESVRGRIYRIVPADGPDTPTELEEINQIRQQHGETPFGSIQEVIDAIGDAGHTPLIRYQQVTP
jgi:hypothetical protein